METYRMLVHDFLGESARLYPQKPALVCGDMRYTYRELDQQANQLAHTLLADGLQRGDRVVIHLGNRVETVIAIFAVLKANAIFVCVNRTTRPEKLNHILQDCGAAVLVTEARTLTGTPPWMPAEGARPRLILIDSPSPPPAVDRLKIRTWEDQTAPVDAPPARLALTTDLACLIYTSGTTGNPKGVMCAHENMVFATHAITESLENTADDIVLSVLQLSFTYGLYQLLAMFLKGGTLVLENSFAYPSVILEQMQRERVTGFPGVPTMFTMLLRMDLTQYDLGCLRYFTNAAAPLSPDAVMDLKHRLPQARLFSMYGQTETARSLYLPPAWIEQKPASVGFPLPGTEVWIEDSAGNRLGPNETGELVVRGRHVMRGYWNAPEATATRFRPGTFVGDCQYHTGDLFRTDDDGFLYFVSRQDDIIKCRGEKVAPREVENVLLRFPGITQAAVVGVPDPVLGQAVKAVLVADPTQVRTTAVLAHCRQTLEDFMVPTMVEFRTELPLTPNGKVKRSELI